MSLEKKASRQAVPLVYVKPVLLGEVDGQDEVETARLEGEPEAIRCELCPHVCLLKVGQKGFCRVRFNDGTKVRPTRDGYVSALALDPIEKKPLARFRPGTKILSVGFYGCNMRCSFCQNHEISMVSDEGGGAPGGAWCGGLEGGAPPGRQVNLRELVDLAEELRAEGNVGLCFTYNEPLVHFEFVEGGFGLAKERGLETVLVTNGCFNEPFVRAIAPLTSAWNIDLKCFSEAGYNRLAGDLATVKRTIEIAARHSHVEVTTLVVPGLSDSVAEMEAEAKWLASIDPEIPLHLTRYFPRYLSEAGATSRGLLEELASVARRWLKCVMLGNV